LLHQFEEASDPFQGRAAGVAQRGVEAGVGLPHVLIDDLQREVLFILKVMVERALRDLRGRQQGLNAQVVVAVLEEHGQPRVKQSLFGSVLHEEPGEPFTFAIMWSMTWLCSCWGLNMMISASASTFTMCPAGQ